MTKLGGCTFCALECASQTKTFLVMKGDKGGITMQSDWEEIRDAIITVAFFIAQMLFFGWLGGLL